MKKSILRFGQRLSGEAAVRLASMLFIMFLAKSLGADTFGRYSSALAYVTLFAFLVDLGTNTVLTRDIARNPERRTVILETIHALKLSAILVAYGLLWVSTLLIDTPSDRIFLIRLLGIVILIQAWGETATAILLGQEEMGWEACLKVLLRWMVLGAGAIALWKTQSLDLVAISMAIAAVFSFFAGYAFLATRTGVWKMKFHSDYLRSLVQSSLPLLVAVAFWIFYDNQDILILSHFGLKESEIGFFAAASKVIDVLRVLPVLLIGVFFAHLSFLAREDFPAFITKCKRIGIYLIVLTSFLMFIVLSAAPQIVQMLYSEEFLPAAPLLRLLLPAYLGIAINHLLFHMLIAMDQERLILWAAIVACVSNLAVAWFLVPQLGTVGACWSLVASEALFFVFLTLSIRASLKVNRS